MKTNALLIKILIVLFHIYTIKSASSQEFWLTAYEFPGGVKKDICVSDENCLYVIADEGIFKSCDEGIHFELVFSNTQLFSVCAEKSGIIVAGGKGKIYFSEDKGNRWDSISISTSFPIHKIIQNRLGNIFAITGLLTENGYEGDGVFFSENKGKSWQKRNTGLGIYTCVEQIACDKNNRMYLAAADEFITGNSGLFISENEGLNWEHVDIAIDGKNVISPEIKIGNTLGLSISNDDSLYLSFAGTAANAGIRLNTVKHINDVKNNTYYFPYQINLGPMWWYDKLLNPVFFAENGDQYSSASGSVAVDGTYYRNSSNKIRQKINYGLGTDINGRQNLQKFASVKSGKIFMIQYNDERIYFTNKSLSTEIDNMIDFEISIYPNPIKRGNYLQIQTENNPKKLQYTIMDMSAKEVGQGFFQNNHLMFIDNQISKGVYFIRFSSEEKSFSKKIVITD